MAIRTLHRRVHDLSWVHRAILVGAVLTLLWTDWHAPSLDGRVITDLFLFVILPGALALAYGKDLGWRISRPAIRNAILLGLFVLPFYLVGSTLPTIRSYYPMWGLHSTTPAHFLPYAGKQLLVVIAAETYYRGLLCVSVREIGVKAVFISPIAYALAHAAKPPIELVLSGPTDVLFGAVDYHCQSILPSVIAHGFGLILLDWLVLHPPLIDPGVVLDWLSWLPLPL